MGATMCWESNCCEVVFISDLYSYIEKHIPNRAGSVYGDSFFLNHPKHAFRCAPNVVIHWKWMTPMACGKAEMIR